MERPMMQMYFHFRIQEPILLEEWMPTNMTAYLLSLLGVLALGAGYETVRVVRALLFQWAENRERQEEWSLLPQQQCCQQDEEQQIGTDPQRQETATSSGGGDCNCLSPQLVYSVHRWPFSSQLCSGLHLTQSLLHFFQFFLGFSLMMVAMTYNVPIFAALLIGHSLGYFLTAPLYRHGLAEEGRIGGECCCS